MEGLDLYPAMLRRLRDKASALGFKPQLYEANMANFRLPRRYALIMIPFTPPARHPVSTQQTSASSIDPPCLRTQAITVAHKATAVPTDRSIPPAIMITVLSLFDNAIINLLKNPIMRPGNYLLIIYRSNKRIGKLISVLHFLLPPFHPPQ